MTKEEISELPVMAFEGKIHLILDHEKCVEAVEKLSKEKIIGFDTECRPAF